MKCVCRVEMKVQSITSLCYRDYAPTVMKPLPVHLQRSMAIKVYRDLAMYASGPLWLEETVLHAE